MSMMNSQYPSQYHPTTRENGQYPIYAPVQVNQDLPENFALWPPTPQAPGGKSRPAVTGTTFTYSLPEDFSTTALAWDASIFGLPDSQSFAPNGIGIAGQFNSPIEGEQPVTYSYVGNDADK